MRRTLKFLLLTTALMAVLTLCGLTAACTDDDNAAVGKMTLVVAADSVSEYEIELSDFDVTEGVLSVLKHLKSEGKLRYEYDDTGYGAYVTEIGGLTPSGNQFICIYTSVEKDFDVSVYATTVEYDGKTLGMSGLGISEMTVESGCVIYFAIGTF